MEQNLKIPFFKRVKRAIVNFEFYADFASEKIGVAIKYYAKLMLIFSIIIAIAFCYKFSKVINNEDDLQIMYNQMAENGVDMQLVKEGVNYIKNNANTGFYAMLALSVTLYMFAAYFILGMTDVILISILGLIISRITRVILKYKAIFAMSIYSLTLPIILNCIYVVVNTLTGFTIEHFSLVYNVISYIYIVTAILMIKTFLIENRQELIEIINEQRRVKQEQREKEKEKKDNNEENNDEEDKKPEEGENPIQT